MSRLNVAVTRRAAVGKQWTALLVAGLLLLLAQPTGHAQLERPPLKFFKNYFLPGADYAVGGVGLRGQGVNGLATNTITIGGVPNDAQIAAAFFYWVTLEPNDTQPMGEGAYFNGQLVSGKEIGPGVRVPGCWGSGGGAGVTSSTTQARVYRADILKNFNLSTDPATLGKPIVNGTHTISVPDTGGGGTQAPSSGNQVTYAEGGAILIVYNNIEGPLGAVVIYDGTVTADQDIPSFSLDIAGYYDATASPNAKVTHLVADGGLRPETLSVNNVLIADSNPFRSQQGTAWDNPTYAVTGAVLDTGIPTSLSFPSASIDCLTWAGVVTRLDVEDGDNDGIPSRLEDSETPLVEPPSREFPMGLVQPDYRAMGADSTIPDVFLEFGYFKTTTGWSGYPNTSSVGPHSHRPSVEALEMVARAHKRAGINAHFDVGVDPVYPAGVNPRTTSACSNLQTWTLACAIVPADHARGLEFITERACGLDGLQACQFTSQEGVVGWKSGYAYFRDAWVDATTGLELTPQAENLCEQSGGCGRRRFDENRRDFWRYSLWAHALGLAKDPNQCLSNSVFDPVDNRCEDSQGNHVPDNPLFHVTGTHSGFADKWGGDILITLHGFGFNYNGAPIAQAGTLLHELAHTYGRGHAGPDTVPNCKTNYVTSANYMFQVHGIPMLDAFGQPILGVDLSGQVLNPVAESGLNDSKLTVQGGGDPTYATRWYAPAATSFIHSGLGITAATKHCNGSPKLPTDPDMVRVDGTDPTAPIDWLADGDVTDTNLTQDINYNGGPNPLPAPDGVASDGPFTGSNDWLYVLAHGLRQVGSRPNMGLLSVDVFTSDLGRGDPGRGDPGRGDPGRGDPGRGDPGRGDPGRGDPGRGDPGRGDPGAPGGDLDIETATGHAQAPYMFRAAKENKTVRLTWLSSFVRPQGVEVRESTLYRVEGTTITPANFAKRKLIAIVPSPATTVVDDKPINGKPVVYILYEDWTDNPSTRSGFVTVGFTYK